MSTRTFLVSFLISSIVLAAETKPNNVALTTPTNDAKAAKTPVDPNEPDVSKMPFTPDSIRQVVSYHHPKVIACYEDLLAGRRKPVEGTLMTWFVIDPEGLVSQVKILKKRSTINVDALNDCVMAVISTMTFPKPTTGKNMPIEFPFKLTAVE